MWGPQPACPAGVDDSLGPWAGDECRGGFDFTLLFEEAVLAVPLHCLLLLVLPACALRLAGADVKVVASTQRALKAVRLLASLGVGLLSWLEHDRSVRPSFVLSTYLFLSVLLDTARARTLWMLGPNQTIPAIFTCTLALRAVMILLESTEKRRILVPQHKGYSKEVTSGTFNRSVFFWLTSLFINGYRNILKLEDLYPLDPKLASEPLYKKLADAWDQARPGALFSTWLRVFAGPMSAAVIPKLFQIGFNYAQPLLIQQAIELAGLPQTREYRNRGFGLIGAYVLVYTGIAVSTGQYEWRTHRTAAMLRGSATALIYQKALRLDLTSPNVSPAGALTLVGTDSEQISQGVNQLHEIWGGLVEIGIGIYLIYRQLGAAFANRLEATIILMGFLAVPTGKASAQWIKASQDRVTTTSKTLGSIKWLKVSGLNDVAFSVIQNLRSTELVVSKRYRVLLGISMMLTFTAISILTLVNQPLAGIIMALPITATAVTSFQRIQDFLNGKERADSRVVMISEKRSKSLVTPETSMRVSTAIQDIELSEVCESEACSKSLPEDIVASVQGTFSWSDDAKSVIDIESWSIRRRAFTLVLGPVGCGKSTLLKALLGELSSFRGTIRTNFSGATYCGQSAWIPNATMRDIVVGHGAFDESWYRRVIAACALEQDIASWPNGDRTVAGTKGISMSGGQKHRLAIARALYARQELLLLDDVFSGLDSGTEEVVFGNLLGSNGLLRNNDTTVVLVSSDSRRLPFADDVVFLNEDGQIKAAELASKSSQLSDLAQSKAVLNSTKDVTVSTSGLGNEKPPEAVINALEEQADATRQLGDWAMYSFYAKAAGWFSLSMFAGFMVVFAFFDSFPDIWLKWWTEANEQRPNQDLGKWVGVYAALGVGSIVSFFISIWFLFIVIINHSGVYFHSVLLDTTSRAPMSFHSSIDSGVTVNRFSQDLQLIDMELPAAALGVAVGVVFGIARFVMMSVSSRYMAVILPFLVPAFYALQHFYLRTSRQMRLLDIEHKAPLYTQLIETLEGLAIIRAFKWEDAFEAANMHRLDNSQRPSYLLSCLQRWLTFAVDMTITVIALILIVLVTTLREQIGPAFIGIALNNVLSFSGVIKALITSWVMLEVSLGAVARVRNFAANTKPEGASHELREPDGEWPGHGAVELRDVTASYLSGAAVLKGISMSIEPGQKVAICGRTGSGKSSIVLSLLRMLDLDSGSITIDGIDLSTLPHEYVRSHLVAVPQESYIFDGSVRLNIDPTGTVPDSDVVEALDKVQLWGKVEERGGLDALIDDKFFSQGEAQLLVFARAMLRKGKVLILDEITSSLNDESSHVIDEVLRSWFQDWTIIAIAHKLESIVDFDRVAVVDAGGLVEYGRPKELLGRNSAFKALYERSSTTSD
ncbi:ABC transporter [Colletotrichum sp. SAR 10_70]|nr:ABC transporter [Colletotrichum sp. SAR 10_71]KAI8162374.1 ABC transporter [Colletotrichum sp. SAR 10_70]